MHLREVWRAEQKPGQRMKWSGIAFRETHRVESKEHFKVLDSLAWVIHRAAL